MPKYETYEIKDQDGIVIETLEATSETVAMKEYLRIQKETVSVEKKKHVSPYKPDTMEHHIHEMIIKKFKKNGYFSFPDGSKHEVWMIDDEVIDSLVKGVMEIREND